MRAVAGKVERLALFPLLGRTGVYQDTRELVVHKNYLVTYRVRADEVQVLQVWHFARRLNSLVARDWRLYVGRFRPRMKG